MFITKKSSILHFIIIFIIISEQTHENEDSYITISENSTTDTSIHDSNTDTAESSEESDYESSDEESEGPNPFRFFFNLTNDESNIHESSDSDESSNEDSFETNYLQMPYGSSDVMNVESESDNMEWDVTTSSVDVPVFEFTRSPRFNILQAARGFL